MSFSDPQKNLETLGLSEGSVVADLGAGSGFYTMAVAKIVGSSGKVYAIDVQQDLLSRLKNTAHQARFHNIEVIHGDIEKLGGTRLKDHSVDVALVCNVFFQIEQKEDFLKEVKRIVKPSGRVLLIEWADSFGGMGPQPEHVVPEQKAEEFFKKTGFTSVTSFNAGDHHYGSVYRN